jgi:hypothetical protein
MLRPVPDAAALAAEHFTRREQEALAALPARDRDQAFLTCWTRKEACLKAIGVGLLLSPQSFEVGIAPDCRSVELPVAGRILWLVLGPAPARIDSVASLAEWRQTEARAPSRACRWRRVHGPRPHRIAQCGGRAMNRFEPLMFGPASRQVFGVFHAADQERAEDTAVLLCPPFGQEGLRTHRFFKVLAERLSRAGIATLRFDFYGSGDSPGDESEGELDGWRRDLCSRARRAAPARAGRLHRVDRCTPGRHAGRAGRAQRALRPGAAGAVGAGDRRRAMRGCCASSTWPPSTPPSAFPTWPGAAAWLQQPDALPEEALGTALSPALRAQLAALVPESLPLTALHDTLVLAEPRRRAHRAVGGRPAVAPHAGPPGVLPPPARLDVRPLPQQRDGPGRCAQPPPGGSS